MKTIGKRRQLLLSYAILTAALVLSFARPGAAQQKTTKTDAGVVAASANAGHDAKADAAASDPVIQAMREELGALVQRVPTLGFGRIHGGSGVWRAAPEPARARTQHTGGSARGRLQAGQLLRTRHRRV